MGRRVRCEVWLTEGDRPLVGGEEAALLSAIAELRSLPAAAETRGLSAEEAGKIISAMEDILGARVTGPGGLTSKGIEVLEEYRNKKQRADEQLANAFRNPTLTADGIVIMDGRIVLVRRGREPGKGKFALPGGFVEYGERAEECAVREVLEETGLRTEPLELVGIYSDPARDPRGHVVSAAFHLRAVGGALRAGDDADRASLFDLNDLPDLAFDHARIIADHLKGSGRAR